MNKFQFIVIGTLALAAAARIMLFDKRGKTHKPLAALIAYLTFVQMAALALAAYMQAGELVMWLLIFALAVQVGAILLAGGNIVKIYRRDCPKVSGSLPTPQPVHTNQKAKP